jgi:hypothetical protein
VSVPRRKMPGDDVSPSSVLTRSPSTPFIPASAGSSDRAEGARSREGTSDALFRAKVQSFPDNFYARLGVGEQCQGFFKPLPVPKTLTTDS